MQQHSAWRKVRWNADNILLICRIYRFQIIFILCLFVLEDNGDLLVIVVDVNPVWWGQKLVRRDADVRADWAIIGQFSELGFQTRAKGFQITM